MPRNNTAATMKRRFPTFDSCLFDAARLQSEDALETAIGVLGAHLENPALPIEEAIEDVLPIGHLLEFGISAVEETAYFNISRRILQSFPTSPGEFSSSLAEKLLRRFCLFFYFLSYLSPAEEPANIREHHSLMHLVHSAMDALSPHISADDQLENNTIYRWHFNGKGSRIVVISQPFHDLGMDVPTSREAAIDLAANLVARMRGVMKDYLVALRCDSLKLSIKQAFLPANEFSHTEATDAQLVTVSSEGIPIPMMPPQAEHIDEAIDAASFSPLEHIHDAVDMANARDLGPWPVHISKPAANDLRQMCKREPELFKFAMRKIKELSYGPTYWTPANHDRLNVGNQTDVPIYAAKLTGDARMIYQVDSIPGRDNMEKQALKFFGIYTHAQMNKHLWETVGRALVGRGSEYRRRCNVRRDAVGGIVLPETFPRLPVPEPLARTTELPTLSPQDLGKLQDILILNKYYPFSQALLKSILADMELSLEFGVSEEENEIIEHPSSCYVIGRSGTGKTTTMLFRMLRIERLWQVHGEGSAKPRQLFVTKSRRLAFEVEKYFHELQQAHTAGSFSRAEVAAAARSGGTRSDGLVNPEDLDSWRDDLPERWDDLQDEHFPLFITYDKLVDMIQEGFPRTPGRFTARREPVTYETFKAKYWPSFPQALTRNLDAMSVFGEFMGVIRGSEETLAMPSRRLELQQYRTVKQRRAHSGLAHEADSIYQLYDIYLKMKRARGEQDMADRTHAVLEHMMSDGIVTMDGVPGRPVDFLYVDEVQDNLLIDLLVLRSLCRNPRGLFWAGDTAQTISAGSTFRFNDLKAFMYRVEAMFRGISLEQPRLFQLCVNYRSHAGIVNCAQSIVELLTLFWPNSIDILGQERGLVDGPKPMFFAHGDEGSSDFGRFLTDDDGTSLHFGAKQCVLVQNAAARRELKKQFGEVGQILTHCPLARTLYESKGQEFDDVLLYNFFEDSGIESTRWRVILRALPPELLSHRLPKFDDLLHNPLCHALKTLYVAVTRARKNLWIFDNPSKSDLVISLWTAKGLVDVWEPGARTFLLAKVSSNEEWAAAARAHFDNGVYEQASYCYAKASMFKERTIADAFALRMHARNLPERPGGTARSDAFKKAGQAFCNLLNIVWTDQDAYLGNAAWCYKEAGDYLQAATMFIRIRDYTEVALCYRAAGRFDDCVQIVRDHRGRINKHIAEEITVSAARAYFDEGKDEKAISMFSKPEDALDFMKDHGFHEERARFYARLGKPREAATAYLQKGLVLFAIDMFLKDKEEESIKDAKENLRRELWGRLSFGVVPDREETGFRSLKRISEEIMQHLQLRSARNEVAMFLAILSGDVEQLCLLAVEFLEGNNFASALLCLDNVFMDMTILRHSDKNKAVVMMESFLQYIGLMSRVAKDANTCNDAALRKLFSIKYSQKTGYTFSTAKHAFLRELPQKTPQTAKNNRNAKPQKMKSPTSVVVMERLRLALSERLSHRLLHEGTTFAHFAQFTPCVSFSLFGDCVAVNTAEGQETCERSHEQVDVMDASSYHTRARLILQRLLASENARWALDTCGHANAVSHAQRTMLEELYIALVPCFIVCNSVPAFDHNLVPEVSEGAAVVLRWLHDIASYPWSPPRPYGIWLMRAELATLDFFLGKADVRAMTDTLPAFSGCNLEHLLRQWDVEGSNIVPRLLAALAASGPRCVSLGILYFLHITDFQLPVGIEALCDLMEYISAVIILASRMSSLHDTTLPRHAVLQLAGWDFSLVIGVQEYARVFLGAVAVTLERLCRKENIGHIIPERRYANTEDERIFFITRICRMLGIHGHNLREAQFTIEKIFKSVRRPGVSYKGVGYEGYIMAQTWADVRRANDASPKQKDLVHLYHHDSKSGSTIPGAKRVMFDTWKDLTEESMSRFRRAAQKERGNLSARSSGQGTVQAPIGYHV